MNILSLWIFLFISVTAKHGLSKFPENFVLAEEGEGPVTLTCNTTKGSNVMWKFKRQNFEETAIRSLVRQDGQHLIFPKVGYPMLGEYSCWSEGHMLSSVYLLFKINEPVSEFDCRANSYDCNFHCTLRKGQHTAVRVGLGPDCNEGLKSCQWVTEGVRDMMGEIKFQVSHSLSPYAEENTMMEVTAEAIIGLSIVRKIKKFFLRDIIQPDSPQIISYKEVGQNLNVSIEPPSSWSTPHSYFSLEHQIQYRFRDDNQSEFSSSTLIPKMISSLRARSRDSLLLSCWSQWSQWKNVRRRKNNICKCKNSGKRLCLKSENVDYCKKKRKNERKKTTRTY